MSMGLERKTCTLVGMDLERKVCTFNNGMGMSLERKAGA